jgi:hypothetical protein
MDSKLAAAVSLSVKLNMGNYQTAELFMSVSGITEQTTPAEVDALLDGPASNTFGAIKARLRTRMEEMRPKKTGASASDREVGATTQGSGEHPTGAPGVTP